MTMTDRRPSPPEHAWTQKQNAAYVVRIRNKGDRAARDGKLEVAPELIRPPLHLLVQLSEKEPSSLSTEADLSEGEHAL